jgi:hypothetical protein
MGKEKLFVVALILCSCGSRALETNPIDLIFSGVFVVAHSQNWYQISLYRSSNARITSDVLKASLSNSFKDYWNVFFKRKMLLVRAVCK